MKEEYYTFMGDTQCKFCESFLHPRCVYHKCANLNEDGYPVMPRRDHLLCDDGESIVIVIGEKDRALMFQQIKELPWNNE